MIINDNDLGIIHFKLNENVAHFKPNAKFLDCKESTFKEFKDKYKYEISYLIRTSCTQTYCREILKECILHNEFDENIKLFDSTTIKGITTQTYIIKDDYDTHDKIVTITYTNDNKLDVKFVKFGYLPQ